jgi:hypothetical protein
MITEGHGEGNYDVNMSLKNRSKKTVIVEESKIQFSTENTIKGIANKKSEKIILKPNQKYKQKSMFYNIQTSKFKKYSINFYNDDGKGTYVLSKNIDGAPALNVKSRSMETNEAVSMPEDDDAPSGLTAMEAKQIVIDNWQFPQNCTAQYVKYTNSYLVTDNKDTSISVQMNGESSRLY